MMPSKDSRDDPDLLARLLAEPTLAAVAPTGAVAVLWGRDGTALWWSPQAALVAAHASAPARERIAVLAGGLGSKDGMRLERLRFAAGLKSELLTCAARRMALASGEDALLTVITGPLPVRLRAPERRLAQAPVPMSSEPKAEDREREDRDEFHRDAPEPDPLQSFRELAAQRPTVRFVWETDAEGVFLRVSPDLGNVVGPQATALVGCRWSDLGHRVLDQEQKVAGALASQKTWSGLSVLWRIGDSPAAVAVELAAVPVQNRERRFSGFRGFGLCRLTALDEAAFALPRAPQIATQEAPAEAPAAQDAPAVSPHLAAEPTDGREDARPPKGSGPCAAAELPAQASVVVAAVEAVHEGTADVADAPTPIDVPVDPAPVAQVAALAEVDALAEAPALVEATEPTEALAAADPAAAGSAAGAHEALAEVAAELKDMSDAVLAEAPEAKAFEPVPSEDVTEPAPADAASVLQDRPGGDSVGATPARVALSMNERNAFREIARALGARFAGDDDKSDQAAPAEPLRLVPRVPANDRGTPMSVLDRLPLGVIVNRGDSAVYANRSFLELSRYPDLEALQAAGLAHVFGGRSADIWTGRGEAPVFLLTPEGERVPVDAQLTSIDWEGAPATVMTFRRFLEPLSAQRMRALELDLKSREVRESELTSILDTATDGVIVLDERGRMLSLNRSAEALFGYNQNEVAGEMFTLLLARESYATAFDYLEGLKSSGVASVLNDGRDVVGRVRQGGRCPLFMTMGRVGDGPERKFCMVLRDMTAWKKAEGELLEAKRAAERASAQKSDFLAKISHEIRTPLNAIIGFAEVMLEERFGSIGNDRYKEYLRDIHASGGHVISLVNDLLDLAKIEAGKLELSFTRVSLNEVVSGCVALMQPQAGRSRIVLRNSLAPKLPPVVADERSMRQVVLNVLSNAIKFTDAGGQVIVSTTLTERGEVTLRVRDTGIGMTEKEVEAALEPFRQLATARNSGGTGLGLPLTKALVEANRGSLGITSVKHEGTLVEVVMPRTRVLAE